MQIYAPGNYRRYRLLTTFVALLYVFLCTFGVLTHDAAHGNHQPGAVAGRHRDGSATRVFTVACHCAFCSWQANSVSPALPIRHFDSLVVLTALIFASPAVRPHTARTLRASSRAPPLA